MATIVMDMSGYGSERETPILGNHGNEEVQSSLDLQPGLMEVAGTVVADRHVILDPELARVDIDTFLQNMYCRHR